MSTNIKRNKRNYNNYKKSIGITLTRAKQISINLIGHYPKIGNEVEILRGLTLICHGTGFNAYHAHKIFLINESGKLKLRKFISLNIAS
jgi:hypothetical protein